MIQFSRNGSPPLIAATLALGLTFAGCGTETTRPSSETRSGAETALVAAAGAETKTAPASASPAPAGARSPVKPGQKAPDFTLKTLNGGAFRLHAQLKQGPVLISFFNPT